MPRLEGSWAVLSQGSAANTPVVQLHVHAVSRRLGTEACAEIVQRYQDGEKAQTIADDFSVSRNAVLNLLRANHIVVRRQPPTDEQIHQLVDGYESGLTIAELAKRHHVSTGAVRNVLKSRVVAMRPRGFQPANSAANPAVS